MTGRSAIMVSAWAGQPTAGELEREADAGHRPRTDYVEIARRLDADVIDGPYMAERARPLARQVASRVGMEQGQILEVLSRARHYRHIVAWGDRLGMGLALGLKLTRARRDVVSVSHYVSTPRRAAVIRALKPYRQMKAIINYSSLQVELGPGLGLPPEQLELLLQPVDERFWQPEPAEVEDVICALGSEARDYPTLEKAVEGLPVRAELAVGSMVYTPTDRSAGRLPSTMAGPTEDARQSNVAVHRHLEPAALRSLYSRSRFVVLPLLDVDFDAGVTAVTEAMAMQKAVVVSRTRGQRDVLQDGVQGLYVPPGDPAALRAAIERLLADPAEAERMGRAGRELVEQKHALDRYVDRFVEIVERA